MCFNATVWNPHPSPPRKLPTQCVDNCHSSWLSSRKIMYWKRLWVGCSKAIALVTKSPVTRRGLRYLLSESARQDGKPAFHNRWRAGDCAIYFCGRSIALRATSARLPLTLWVATLQSLLFSYRQPARGSHAERCSVHDSQSAARVGARRGHWRGAPTARSHAERCDFPKPAEHRQQPMLRVNIWLFDLHVCNLVLGSSPLTLRRSRLVM